MPFKFWKKEEEKKPEKKEEKKAAPPPAGKKPGKEEKAATPAPPAPAKPVPKRTPEEVAADAHRALVEAGLTIDGTRDVFRKRVVERFGSLEDFQKAYAEDAPDAMTRFIAGWLGFDVPAKFELADLLYLANQRLSSFGIQVNAAEEIPIDESQGLREATLSVGDKAVTLQFQTPRDVFNEINRLVVDHKARFLELETWSSGFAFMLARGPNWDRLAKGGPVVVKADETATAGECKECGSGVGHHWATCIGCNAGLG